MEKFLLSPYETLLVSLVFLLLCLFAFLVFVHDKNKKRGKYFSIFSFSFALTIVFAYFSEFFPSTKPSLAILFSKLTYIFALNSSIFLYFFSLILARQERILKISQRIICPIGGIFFFLTLFTRLIVQDIELHPGGFDIIYGIAGYCLLFLFILLFLSAIIMLLSTYEKATLSEKLKYRYFFLGFFIFIFFQIAVNLVIPIIFHTQNFYRIGNYSSIFFVALTAYAIIEKHLFDIRVIATEVLVTAIILVLLVQTFLSKTWTEGLLRGAFSVLVAYLGYLLIKSVKEEIRRRQEIQELTNQLKKANIRLKELDRLKSEFLSVASHELNSPMAIIMGYLHMILWEGFGKVDKNARQYLEKVYFKAQLLAKLVADLLNVSRIEQGRLKIEIEPVDLGAILKDLCEDYATQAKEKGLSFAYHEPKQPLPKVLSDIDKLKEIIQNLLSNAVKFTKTGGVEVNVGQKNGFVEVSVKDTGIGIPKEAQKHIGEKFYRVDNSLVREVGGTGLGLHLVQQYLNLMHGKFWFESEGENKGTTFYFTLPVARG